jgi:hypothetical protein
MCNKFRLIYNIENVPLEDIVTYLKRLVRIYLILIVLSIIDIVTSDKDMSVTFILSIVALALYVLNLFSVKLVSEKPTIHTSILPLITVSILWLFNIAQIIINVVMFKNYFALISLISVVIQMTTIYLLHKLREKIHTKDRADNLHNDIETPQIAIATASPINNGGDNILR